MNTKYLIETLTQIPDKELLEELSSELLSNKTKRGLLIANVQIIYKMFEALFSCSDTGIQTQAIILFQKLISSEGNNFFMRTEIQQAWNHTSKSIIRMLGQQDALIRKRAEYLIFLIIQQTNNANIALEKLYYQGLEDQSLLVMIQSIKCSYKILQIYPTILYNKSSITIMKLILEKIMTFVLNNQHIQLNKNAKQFLDKLFYLKIQRLDEVLTLMNSVLLEKLEQIWKVNKEQLMLREKQDQDKQNDKIVNEIKYEHLPLINGKFFGVYEPYVFKNIFNPQLYTAKNLAIKHFRAGFQSHQSHLQKYLNVIFKILVRFIHEENYDMLFILKKIVLMNGINNIVNLSILPQLLVKQLSTDTVIYRRDLREILKKLNFNIPLRALKAYEQELKQDKNMCWIKLLELFQLIEHWIDHNLEESYPPTLDPFLPIICSSLDSQIVKVRQKSLDLLLTILDRYPGYRQNLQSVFSESRIGEIEDIIQKRKTKGKSNPLAKQAQEIFMKQYQEERRRYIQFQKISK